VLVYHGGYVPIEEINLEKCRPYTDFGKGFYVTKFKHHAENWAKKVGKHHNSDGFVSIFNFIESSFVDYICKKKTFNGYTEEWLDFIVENRNEESTVPLHSFDIVEGPVANDKVQNKLQYYIRGDISKKDFLEDLTYHEETHQVCFCTLASLQTLKYIDKDLTKYIELISENILNALVKDKKINVNSASELFYSSKIFKDIADKGTELYKQDWKKIYKMFSEEIY
jgi:hypothetical protein